MRTPPWCRRRVQQAPFEQLLRQPDRMMPAVAALSDSSPGLARGARSARVLVIEDDRRIGAFLDRALGHDGYAVQVVREGAAGLMLALHDKPDLVILDLMLPDMDGVEVARRLRDQSPVPILVLTARDSVADRVRGLDAGADDYLVKPFALDELLARVRAMLRRLETNATAVRRGRLTYAEVTLDQDMREVHVQGQPVRLRNLEFELLAYFLRNPERVLDRRELREAVWGDDFPGDSNVIEVTVGHLRRKLEAAGAGPLIRTVRPIGYMLRRAADGERRAMDGERGTLDDECGAMDGEGGAVDGDADG